MTPFKPKHKWVFDALLLRGGNPKGYWTPMLQTFFNGLRQCRVVAESGPVTLH
jgi:hypothetical protein